MAPLVERSGIGITVDTLEEINERVKAVSPEQYGAMRKNVEAIAADMAAGKYVRKAAKEAIRQLSQR